ncbi:conserved hypothetical protein [Neospora caninum Liverpool]|nr:conserved hypothetical protein [Neospora caninum Liverpool]CBZ51042.1 conserved hypothetical protein [Neospora caninum Liverpool]|eukprot:XP_003881075.1 conserved hypothetical protein [Neospora caninum Liverpool]
MGISPVSRFFTSSKQADPANAPSETQRTASASPSKAAGSDAIISRPEMAVRVGAGESLIEAMVDQSLKEAEEKTLHARRHQGIELYPGGPVDRYGPPRDPSALLLEPHKLTKEERLFQILFVTLPWVFFLFLLSAPVLLAKYHVAKLNDRAAFSWDVAQELIQESDADGFRLCTFRDLREVVEQPLHAFLCYLHPDTLASQIVAPLLRDLATLFQRLGVRAQVALVDLSDPAMPPRMHREFPPALAPHGQLLLPFAFGGQQPAVLDFAAKTWNASDIVRAVAEEVPSARAALAPAAELDDVSEQLSDCLFSLAFVDEGTRGCGEEARTTSPFEKPASGSLEGSHKTPDGSRTSQGANPVERVKQLNLIGDSGREALRKCSDAREKLRAQGTKEQTL